MPPQSEPEKQPTQSLVAGSTPIQNNTLYANTSSGLWLIDPNTGTSTYIGPINYTNVSDIAFSENSLYGVTFTDFLSIDPTTGNAADIGPIGYNTARLPSRLTALSIAQPETESSSGSTRPLAQEVWLAILAQDLTLLVTLRFAGMEYCLPP
jgi:hypothetical protein